MSKDLSKIFGRLESERKAKIKELAHHLKLKQPTVHRVIDDTLIQTQEIRQIRQNTSISALIAYKEQKIKRMASATELELENGSTPKVMMKSMGATM